MDVVRAKLIKPEVPDDIIRRIRLIDRISAGGRRTIVLNAPPGYGKTVLMTQIPLARSEIVLWYRLDDTDNSFRQFLQYISAAMEPYFPGVEQSFSDLLTLPPDELLPDVAAGRVLDILDGVVGRITLFLDDVHLLVSPAIRRFLLYLAQYANRKFRMIMATEKPFPGLDELPLDRRPLELDVVDLRFSREETEQYLDGSDVTADRYPLDGWVLGLSILKQHGWKTLRDEMDLLARQIFTGSTPYERELLTILSYFPNATPALCDRVLAVTAESPTALPPAAETLQNLQERGGLCLTESGGMYSVHPAMVSAFRQHHNLTSAQRQAALGELIREGQHTRAMGIALENGDGKAAVNVLQDSSYALLSLSGADRIRYFYSLLPVSLCDRYPPLYLLAATGALLHGEEMVWDYVAAAEKYFEQTDDDEGGLFAGLLHAVALRKAKRMEEAKNQIRKLFDDASSHPVAQIDLIGEIVEMARQSPVAMRDFSEWRDKLYQTMETRVQDPFALRLLSRLSLWYAFDGQPQKAWEVHRVLTSWFGDYGPEAEVLIQRCRMAYAEEVLPLMREALHRAEDEWRPSVARAPYLLGLGLCLRLTGSTEAALSVLERGSRRAEEEKDDDTAFQCRLELLRTQAIQSEDDPDLKAVLAFKAALTPEDTVKADQLDALLAAMQLSCGNPRKAAGIARKVLERSNPEVPTYAVLESVLVLSCIDMNADDPDAARQWLALIPETYFSLSSSWLAENPDCSRLLLPYLHQHKKTVVRTAFVPEEETETKYLNIQFFKDMRVEADGVPIRWRTHRARDLFFFLALHRGVKIKRATLIENVFPHSSKSQLSHQVKNTLSLLRRGLDRMGFKQMVIVAGGEYWLDDDRLQGDYYRLLQILHEWESLNDDARADALVEACSLYKGELCRGLDFPFLVRLRKSIHGQMETVLLKEIQREVAARSMEWAAWLADELCRISPDNDTYASIRQALSRHTATKTQQAGNE